MLAALCLFLVGASFGVFLAFRHFTRRRLPITVAILHGAAGAIGFALLLLAVLARPDFRPARIATAILIVAVAFGCVNAVYHVRGARHRSALVFVHALLAVAGVGTLAYGVVLGAVHPQGSPLEIARASSDVARSDVGSTTIAPAVPPVPEPSAATDAPAPPAPPPVGWAFREHAITFENDSAILSDAARAAVSAIARRLMESPAIGLVEIQGYADPRGDDAYNVALTRARARAVRDALVGLGISPGRLRSTGYGARCPLDPTCRPPSCVADKLGLERRVAFLVLEAEGARYRGPITCSRAEKLISPDDVRYHAP